MRAKPRLVVSAATVFFCFLILSTFPGSAGAGDAGAKTQDRSGTEPSDGPQADANGDGAARPEERYAPIYFYPFQSPSTAPSGDYAYTVPLGGAAAPGGTMRLRSAPYAQPQFFVYPDPARARASSDAAGGGVILVQERRPRPPQELEAPEAERPKAEKPREELLLEAGAVLLRRGNLQVEPSIDYAHFSTDRVAIGGVTIFEAIVIGTIRVDKLDRDIVTPALTTRYGITNRLQVETRIPGAYREDREVLGLGTVNERERQVDNIALGDIEAGVSYQAVLQRRGIPGVILRLRSRFPTGEHPFEIPTESVGAGERRLTEAPTGSGFYSVEPGVTLVWRVDPVVFFGGASYAYNIERNFGPAFGNVDPGDTVEFFAGLNLALSERVAINMSFVDQITGTTEQNGIESPGTSFNDGRLSLGTSVGLDPRTSLLITASAGLTRQSPDFQFTVSLPMTFGLF